MAENNINESKFPVSSIILSMIGCMMAFSGATSYIVEIISYSRIDFLTVAVALSYVIMFAATVVMTFGFCFHSRGKQRLISIGSFMLAFAYIVKKIIEISFGGFDFGQMHEHFAFAVYIATLVICGIYYLTGKAFLGYPVKMVFSVLAITCAAVCFVNFLMHPEGQSDYVASWNMYPFFIYIAYLLYTPFKKGE